MTPEDQDTTESEPEPSTAAIGPPPHTAAGPGATAPHPDTSERLASRIEEDVDAPLPWRSIVKKTVAVVVFGITIYLVFPSLAAVFSSFPKLTSLDPIWFTFALALEVAHFICTIALQRIALRTKAWFPVATSQLAGNAISLVVPGGAAVGAATQFRMLSKAGNDTATAVGGLTAFSLLGIAGLLALPVFVLPAILAGTPIARGLQYAALLGLGGFFLFAGFGAAVLALDGPMRWAGRVIQAVRNRWRRKDEPMTDLPERLVRERDRIRQVLGARWKAATLLSSGRLFLDFGCLLAAIRATGARPNPSLVLLAYAVAGLLALIPITPGGLGIVEAGLSGLLILAGVPGGDAVVATLAYRILSYWLPILVGPFAYFAFRLRYGAPRDHSAGPGESGPALAPG
ncbi:MAG TPA: YbhN family protein [Acidimicrobiales bacterium]